MPKATSKDVWKIQVSVEYMLSTIDYFSVWWGFGWRAGSFVSKRIENGRRTFDKTGKVGMLIIVFWFAENTKGKTDFIRANV